MHHPAIGLDVSAQAAYAGGMLADLPPAFFLYGEPPRSAEPDFFHVEDLATRSAPYGWRIAAHSHADLAHVILIRQGGGEARFDGVGAPFCAPHLLVVPARVIHEFVWHEDTTGQVLTMAEPQLQHLIARHGDLAPLFARARMVPLSPDSATGIGAQLVAIGQELSWISLGRCAALEASLTLILVAALRLVQQQEGETQAAHPPGRLVARYRRLIEARYRLREKVGDYARALGVSETALREACAAAGQAPAAMRDHRSLLEAQRLLAFSALTIAQIAEATGFADPAYFSRFFQRQCGLSPGRWRARLRKRQHA